MASCCHCFLSQDSYVLSVVLLLKSKPSTLYHGWFGQNRAVNENQALAQHMHTQRYLGHVYNGQISDEASRCFPHGSIYIWSFLTWKRQCEFEHMYTFRYGGTQNNETNLEGLKQGWVCVSAPTHTEAHTRERSRAWNVPVWKMNE